LTCRRSGRADTCPSGLCLGCLAGTDVDSGVRDAAQRQRQYRRQREDAPLHFLTPYLNESRDGLGPPERAGQPRQGPPVSRRAQPRFALGLVAGAALALARAGSVGVRSCALAGLAGTVAAVGRARARRSDRNSRDRQCGDRQQRGHRSTCLGHPDPLVPLAIALKRHLGLPEEAFALHGIPPKSCKKQSPNRQTGRALCSHRPALPWGESRSAPGEGRPRTWPPSPHRRAPGCLSGPTAREAGNCRPGSEKRGSPAWSGRVADLAYCGRPGEHHVPASCEGRLRHVGVRGGVNRALVVLHPESGASIASI
jgi:hypothetical protein